MSFHYTGIKVEEERPDVVPGHSPQLPGAQRQEQIPPWEYLALGKLPLLEGILKKHQQQVTIMNTGGEAVCFESTGATLFQSSHVRSHPVPFVHTLVL